MDYAVPFYGNTPDDTHCFQAALKMVLAHFLPQKEFSWEELDAHTGKEESAWTWPSAGVLWLRSLGFEIKMVERFDYRAFSEKGEAYLVEAFGEEVAREQITHTADMALEQGRARALYESDIVESRVPTIADIVSYLQSGYLVVCLINARSLNRKEGYAGHFVVVKGCTDDTLLIHDPGLPPHENRTVSFHDFDAAWAYPNETAKNLLALHNQRLS